MDEVYVVVMNGGFAGSATLCDASIAVNTIRQLRSGGRRVRVFRDREMYLDFLDKNYENRKRHIALQREVFGR